MTTSPRKVLISVLGFPVQFEAEIVAVVKGNCKIQERNIESSNDRGFHYNGLVPIIGNVDYLVDLA